MKLMLLALFGQVTGSSPPTTTISEGPHLVTVKGPSVSTQIQTVPRSGGKQGWGFDADAKCQTYIIEAQTPDANRAPDANSRLVAYGRGGSDGGVAGKWEKGIVIATSPSGFSSPIVSPDGASLLVVRGADAIVSMDLGTRKEAAVATGWSAFWNEDGSVTTYTRRSDGCHVWRRFKAGGVAASERVRCEGYTVVPIGSGAAPNGAPLPIIDIRGNVLDLLGAEKPIISEPIQLSTGERGAACKAGVDFVSADGRSVTLRASASGQWSIAIGASCTPVESRKGFVKVITCGLD